MNDGTKHDQGKIQPSIVLGDFSRALTEVCKAGETGIVKYGPGDWLSVKNAASRYDSALIRHWLDSKIRSTDPESKLLHLAHVTWNALACLELELRRLEREKLETVGQGVRCNIFVDKLIEPVGPLDIMTEDGNKRNAKREDCGI